MSNEEGFVYCIVCFILGQKQVKAKKQIFGGGLLNSFILTLVVEQEV